MLQSTRSLENESSCLRESGNQSRIRIATTSRIYYIDINDIVRIQSISNYSMIFFSSGKSMIVSKVLAHFDIMLTGYHFVRVHRTHLVNIFCIKHFEHGNMAKIGLYNDEILPVSRSRKKILQLEMRALTA